MYWWIAGLFVLGVACGATIRLMIFIGVLLAAAAITVGGTAGDGATAMLVGAVVAVVALQAGYVGGMGLRAWLGSLRTDAAAETRERRQGQPGARFGEKRR